MFVLFLKVDLSKLTRFKLSVYCDPYKVTNKMAPYRILQFHSLKTWTENNVYFVCLFACFVLFCSVFFSLRYLRTVY